MPYFQKEFLQFLRELPANNNRDWFHENKKRYEEFVKFPFERFITDLIEAFSNEGLTLGDLTAKECMFRINRDIRFSQDKSPYKIHVSALISPGGRKSMNSFGAYVELSGEHVRLYSGAYQPTSEQLLQIRQKIYDEQDLLEELIQNKKFKQNFGEVRGEKNKRINKPFTEIIDKQPLILNKSFYYFKNYEPEIVLEKDFIKQLITDFKIIQPLNNYFEESLR